MCEGAVKEDVLHVFWNHSAGTSNIFFSHWGEVLSLKFESVCPCKGMTCDEVCQCGLDCAGNAVREGMAFFLKSCEGDSDNHVGPSIWGHD